MAFDLGFYTTLVGTTIFLSAPIAFAFLGVMWGELSGVFVFGIEGEIGGVHGSLMSMFITLTCVAARTLSSGGGSVFFG